MRKAITLLTLLGLAVACSSTSVTNNNGDIVGAGTSSVGSDKAGTGGHSNPQGVGGVGVVGGSSSAGGATAKGGTYSVAGSSTNSAGAGTGGASGTIPSTGGSVGVGGNSAMGGTSAATGGLGQVGGASATTGGKLTVTSLTGGAPGNGGTVTTGGASTATGANSSTGGAALGGAATGGKSSTGGAATGGAPANPCASLACVHGTCVATGSTAACQCSTGYSGTLCDTNPNDCAGVTCSSHGTCVDGLATYTCNCNTGYTGTLCQTNPNDCAGVTCSGHGSCVDGLGTYTCTCNAGFSGTACGTAVPPTITQQPQDATVCQGANGTFTVTASGSGTLSYQWNQLVSGGTSNVAAGSFLSLPTTSGTPPYVNSYYVVVTDSSNGATAQSRTTNLTVNPIPIPVRIDLWGQTTDHTWAQLNSLEADGSCYNAVTYRYSGDYGSTWSAWENDGFCYFWPYVGPLGAASGAIVVQAYQTNSYGCNSAITQGAYTY